MDAPDIRVAKCGPLQVRHSPPVGTVKSTDFLEVPLINMPAKSLIFRGGQN